MQSCRNVCVHITRLGKGGSVARPSRTIARGTVAITALFAALVAAMPAAAEEKPCDTHRSTADKSPAERSAGISVLVTRPKSACFSSKFPITGFLLHAQEAVVTFELDGYQVTEVYAQEGDRVSQNQKLVKLDRIGTPEQQPQQPQHQQAQQPQQQQQGMPATLTIVAPAGGRIEKSTARLGEVKGHSSEPLFQIAASDEIEMEADLPAIYLDEIAKEKEKDRSVPVKVLIGRGQPDAREVIGRVKRISPEVDKTTQLGHVRILLAPDKALHAGSFVSATIDAGETCGAISVPNSAVNYGTRGTTVQVVRGECIETRHVRIGRTSDNDVEIKDGIKMGDVIVAHAGTTLRDGDLVTTTPEDSSQSRTERP